MFRRVGADHYQAGADVLRPAVVYWMDEPVVISERLEIAAARMPPG